MPVELLAAIAAPTIAGFFSLALFIGKKNGNAINEGFRKIQTTIERVDVRIDQIDDKVDDLKDDVVRNYVSNTRFEDHIDLQASMQARLVEEVSRMRHDAREGEMNYQKHSELLRDDISQIKEMQWKTRMGLLDLIDRKLRRAKHELEDEEGGEISDVWGDD